MTVSLEVMSEAHAEGLFAALSDPRIYAYLDDAPPVSVAALRSRISRLRAGTPVASGETWLNWTVFAEGVAVGYTQATIARDGCARLAYVLSPAVWGQSVAYAACRLTLDALAARPDVTAVVADTEAGNTRSQALLLRLGFAETERVGADVFYRFVGDAGDPD